MWLETNPRWAKRVTSFHSITEQTLKQETLIICKELLLNAETLFVCVPPCVFLVRLESIWLEGRQICWLCRWIQRRKCKQTWSAGWLNWVDALCKLRELRLKVLRSFKMMQRNESLLVVKVVAWTTTIYKVTSRVLESSHCTHHCPFGLDRPPHCISNTWLAGEMCN